MAMAALLKVMLPRQGLWSWNLSGTRMQQFQKKPNPLWLWFVPTLEGAFNLVSQMPVASRSF